MSRWLSAFLLTVGLLCAPAALAQQIIVPSGGSGAACTVATPCTVAQKVAPVSTSDDGYITNLPTSSSGALFRGQLNGTDKFTVGAGGDLTARGGQQIFGNIDVNYGQSLGWSDGSTNRGKIYQTGGSTCLGSLTIYNNGNTGSVPSVQIGTSATIDGPLVQGICSTATPATRGYTGDIATGTNIAGGKVQHLGGSSTGTGAGGSATLATSPKGSSGAGVNAQRDVLIADYAGHISYGGTIPAVGGSCGTSPAIITGSTDAAGEITTGTGSPTSCTVTFATAYAAAPFCIVHAQTAANVTAYTISTTVLTITTTVASAKIDYVCHGA